jgi:hypothetical protein
LASISAVRGALTDRQGLTQNGHRCIAAGSAPSWDIPVRLLVTLALAGSIMLFAAVRHRGDVFRHPYGSRIASGAAMPRAARRLLRGVMLSLGAFVMFFLVAGAALPCRRPRSAYVMAAGAAMAVGAVQLIFTRTFAAR